MPRRTARRSARRNARKVSRKVSRRSVKKSGKVSEGTTRRTARRVSRRDRRNTRRVRRSSRRMRGGSWQQQKNKKRGQDERDERDVQEVFSTKRQATDEVEEYKKKILAQSEKEKQLPKEEKEIISYLPSAKRLFSSQGNIIDSKDLNWKKGQVFLDCLKDFEPFRAHSSSEFADVYFFVFMVVKTFNISISQFFDELFNKLSERPDIPPSLEKLHGVLVELVGPKFHDKVILWYQDSKTNNDCDDQINGLLFMMCGATILDLSDVKERVAFQAAVTTLPLFRNYYFQDPSNDSGSLYINTILGMHSSPSLVSVFGNKMSEDQWSSKTTLLSLTSYPPVKIPFDTLKEMFDEIDNAGYVRDSIDLTTSQIGLIKPFAKGVPFLVSSISENYDPTHVIADDYGYAKDSRTGKYLLGAPDFIKKIDTFRDNGKLKVSSDHKLIPISDEYHAGTALNKLMEWVKGEEAKGENISLKGLGGAGDVYRFVPRKATLGAAVSSNYRNSIMGDPPGPYLHKSHEKFIDEGIPAPEPKTYDYDFLSVNASTPDSHSDSMENYLV